MGVFVTRYSPCRLFCIREDDPNQSMSIAGSNEREQGAANDGEHLFNLLSEAVRRPPG